MNQPPHPPVQIHVANVEQRVRFEAETLLSIVASLEPYIRPVEGYGEMDAQSALAAQATFIKATTKLDDLLDQVGKDPAPEQNLPKLIADGLQAQIETSKTQRRAYDQTQRPSVVFRPDIRKLDSGHWLASYGDASKGLETAVYGMGASLEEAMREFDQEWVARLADQLHDDRKEDGESEG